METPKPGYHDNNLILSLSNYLILSLSKDDPVGGAFVRAGASFDNPRIKSGGQDEGRRRGGPETSFPPVSPGNPLISPDSRKFFATF